MELTFIPVRVVSFLVLMGLFALLGGFTFPQILADSGLPTSKLSRAWIYCVLMFIGGAACVGDVPQIVKTG